MPEAQSQVERKPIAAFVLALIAGLWMLAGRGMMVGVGWNLFMRSHWPWRHHMMRGAGDLLPAFWLWPWLGIIAGIIVLLGAVMIYSKPAKAQGWGMAILIASAINLIAGMGGFLAGVLGIIGGALAIAWRP
jgi:hypothetical protein